ncbi:hypothetical protein TorRG33x02_168170 [Trema orientale]|uniref:DUF1985 domain-containing protein n=1 Tax=Trema orientale TaxID=63057 RepID=A0A2P5EPC9_TREOI|nr:hypothetical protein TorRG33x02_168170 [Trema orientale]
MAPPLQFSRVLIHQILLRNESKDKMKEMHFESRGKLVRFGVSEFVLVTGLNFGLYLDIPKLKTINSSRRLVDKYLNNMDIFRSGELEDPFLNRVDIKDTWKLDFCYLEDSFLLVGKATKKTMVGLKKDMHHYRKWYLKLVPNKLKPTEAKHIVYELTLPRSIRAYEVVSALGQ